MNELNEFIKDLEDGIKFLSSIDGQSLDQNAQISNNPIPSPFLHQTEESAIFERDHKEAFDVIQQIEQEFLSRLGIK